MYYKKILINSVEDLPKEKGWYFVHWKHHDERLHTQMGVQYYDETITGLWFGKDWFDFYLLPVEQPMYSREFVEWLVLKTQKSRISYGYIEDHEDKNYYFLDGRHYTLDELLAYYETNVKENK